MKNQLKKALLFLLILGLLVPLTAVPASAAGDGVVNYRLLTMACPGSNLGTYPALDCTHVTAALAQAMNVPIKTTHVEPKYTSAWTTEDYSDKDDLLGYLNTAFAGADDDDVNIFYYSGHGSYNSSTGTSKLCTAYYSDDWLTAVDIKDYADKYIKGTLIIIIDACHSGGLVSKNASESGDESPEGGEDEALFAESFAAVFQENSMAKSALTGNNKYKVIAAATTLQTSTLFKSETISSITTTTLLMGMGYSPAKASYNSYPADTDNDGAVSVSELYRWARQNCVHSVCCCYPEYDQTPVVTYDRSKYAGAHLLSASVDPSTLSKGSSVTVSVTYETDVACKVAVEAPLRYYWAEENVCYPDSLANVSYYFANARKTAEFAAGTLTEAGTYRGTGTLTLNTSGLDSLVYYLRLLPKATGGAVVLLPIQIINNSADSSGAGVKLSLPDTPNTTASSFSVSGAAEELRVSITFGTPLSSSYPPSSNVSLYCDVRNSKGQSVRVLADWVTAVYRANDVDDVYEAINDFYWDGRDTAGSYVETGQYTIHTVVRTYTGNSSNPYSDAEFNQTLQVNTPIPRHCSVDFYEGAQKITTQSVVLGETAAAPEDYSTSRTGYTFRGWFTGDGTGGDWGKQWSFTQDVVDSDFRLYARWELVPGIHEITADQSNQLTVSVGAAKNGYVYAAKYSPAGQMVECVTVAVTASDSLQTLSLSMAAAQEYSYLLFLTDTGFLPLTEAVSYAVQP